MRHTHDTNTCTDTMQLYIHRVERLHFPNIRKHTQSDVTAPHSFRWIEGNFNGRLSENVILHQVQVEHTFVHIFNCNCTCVYMEELHLQRTRVWVTCVSLTTFLPEDGPI